MKKLLLCCVVILASCTAQFDPFNNQGNPKTAPDIIKAIEALNQFAVGVDARLKKLEPAPAAEVKK